MRGEFDLAVWSKTIRLDENDSRAAKTFDRKFARQFQKLGAKVIELSDERRTCLDVAGSRFVFQLGGDGAGKG